MQTDKLKISVVTVCYNAVKDIEKTILSVVDQTYDNIEYIIIDGGSTDGTVDIIKKYVEGGSEYGKHKHTIAYWVSEPDKGIYDAMNKGIRIASGDYINFMNAGDRFYNIDVLTKVGQSLDLAFTIEYGQLIKVYKRFQFISDSKAVELDKMNGSSRLPHQAMFTRLDYHKKHLFDLSYKSAADFKFYFSAHFYDHCKFKYLPFPIAYYDAETGMSKDSHIGPIESLKVQGIEVSNALRKRMIIKYKIINFLKRNLPESIITYSRKRKFRKLGCEIIDN